MYCNRPDGLFVHLACLLSIVNQFCKNDFLRLSHEAVHQPYIEFASLREGLLSRYRPIRELTFAGKPFVPPKAYRRMHRERSTPAR